MHSPSEATGVVSPLHMTAITIEQSVELVSPVAKVWPLIIDTDRMNRLLGLGEVKYVPIAEGTKSAARYLAETTIGGLRVVYEEQPFEWTFEKEFGVYRRCTVGPLAFIALRRTLAPTEAGGTRLTLRFETEARNIALYPFAWLGARSAVKNLARLSKEIDAHLSQNEPSPFVAPVAPSDGTALERGIARLNERGVRPDLAARLGAFVQGSSDADAVRIRAFEIADEWKEPRREVLAAMLHAVPSGLLELRWAVLCPSCRTASAQVEALDQIGLEGHCQLCDISFELDLDQAVEATFFPHPSVRRVPEMMFCIGGPARTPHVLVQATLPAKSAREIDVPKEEGRYRVFSRGGGRATLSLDAKSPEKMDVSVHDARVDPVELSVAPGGKLIVKNEEDFDLHVKIERLEYASLASTAHYVSTMEEFRSVFGGDLLKVGTPLKVARVSILFSDLTGSTALYALVGDAAAFRFVDDHFDVLSDCIKEHEGVIVKTMGDAIMASFTDDAACARAAIECMRRFEAFRAKAKHGDKTHIKMGIFSGPCYVITANKALDYFGQTVNVASRLQHQAASGEVIMLEAEAAHVRSLGVTVSAPESVRVKGVDHELRIVRVT